MTDLILHHYPMSPFSQKVRSMLGYAGLSWQSVLTREFPPRPHLEVLAGGYRKMPVAQAGADVFCDSHLIAEEIAARAGRPELVVGNCCKEAQAWVQRVDYDLFFPCVFAAGNRTLRRKARESMSLAGMLRFAWDRINLGRTSRMKITGLRDARAIVLAHAAEMEAMLSAQDFLFGATPCHADFSAWHGLWMIHFLAESSMFRPFPRLVAWLERMHAFGDGTARELSVAESLRAARESTPRPIAQEQRSDARVGREVVVAPDDYALTPTRGVLAGATPTRWIVAREHKDVGTVHVHFPRRGFVLQTA